MVINWWNFQTYNMSLLWEGNTPNWRQRAYDSIIDEDWWNTNSEIEACQKYYQALKRFAKTNTKEFDGSKALETYLKNGNGKALCGHGWTGFFYMPKKFSEMFSVLSRIAYLNKLGSDVAVPNIFRTLDEERNLHTIDNIALEDKTGQVLFPENYKIENTVVEGAFSYLMRQNIAINHKFDLVNC